jgi:REP element-mobilizing transposase RayT
LTKYGKVIETAILSISKHYENVVVDKYVIMPNHVHLIIRINNVGGRMISAPTVIGQMKRWVSIKFGKSIWQKGYYDHIIRDDDDYLTKCKYIENNPEKWCEDKYYII